MKQIAVAFVALALAACSNQPKTTEERKAAEPKKAAQAPDRFYVQFATTKGDFIMEVNRNWAPRGADRVYELVQEKFYDGSRFYRVVKGFIVQFGISGDPKQSELWSQLKLPDDPVMQKNARGSVSFAKSGPGSRTTQLFINLKDNSRQLDGNNFAPVGRIVKGMDVVDSLYAGYGEVQNLRGAGPDAQRLEAVGEEYLERSFPRLDKINSATIVDYKS